jgi:hypothetical protein
MNGIPASKEHFATFSSELAKSINSELTFATFGKLSMPDDKFAAILVAIVDKRQRQEVERANASDNHEAAELPRNVKSIKAAGLSAAITRMYIEFVLKSPVVQRPELVAYITDADLAKLGEKDNKNRFADKLSKAISNSGDLGYFATKCGYINAYDAYKIGKMNISKATIIDAIKY